MVDNYFDFSTLRPDLRDAMDSEMASDEVPVWAQSPNPRRMFWLGLPALLFAIPWTLFALFWEAMASSSLFFSGHGAGGKPGAAAAHGPLSWVGLIFPLFGLPFVGVGFWMLSTPLRQMRQARRTLYAITNRRALIMQRSWNSTRTQSIQPSQMQQLGTLIKPDGSGDIVFGPSMGPTWITNSLRSTSFMNRGMNGVNGAAALAPPAFLGVRDVRHAESLLRTLGESAQKGPAATAPEGAAPADIS